MKDFPIIEDIEIDDFSATPKYIQITKAIIKAVGEERIKLNDVLPSINEMSFSLDISRDTVEKSYRHLKEIGVLASVPGKGYYVKKTEVNKAYKVFLLFNKLSEHKKIIYDTFVKTLGDSAVVDFYVYNNDYSTFRKLIQNRRDDYTHFVVIPLFAEKVDYAYDVLDTIPKDRLILFDKFLSGVKGTFGAVYENFEKNIFDALNELRTRVQKYRAIKIIFPDDGYHPYEIVKGVMQFACNENMPCEVLDSSGVYAINQGDLFINVCDGDLIKLIEQVLSRKFKVGRDVGILSYNEVPYKRLILDGITTVSTDFEFLGRQAAKLILESSHRKIEAPFKVQLRNSV